MIDAIITLEDYLTTKEIGAIVEGVLEGGCADDDENRVLALCEEFDASPSSVERRKWDHYNLDVYTVEGTEYAIGTDAEADAAQDAALDSYLDEGCVEGANGPYFDRDAWKRDAKMDGRGHCLSSYDGNEYDAREFFIYRVN